MRGSRLVAADWVVDDNVTRGIKPRINNWCLSGSGTVALRRARPPCKLARDARYSYHHAPLDLPEQVDPSGLSIEPKRGSVGRIERPVDVPPVRVSRVSLPPQ